MVFVRTLTAEIIETCAQETGISKSSATIATKLFKFWPCRVTVVCALQCDLAGWVNFCNLFLQLVHDGDVDPHLNYFF
jgi:hypothetical protein